MEITFEVPGEPRGKGRPRHDRNGHTYTDSETRAYEGKIVTHYRKTHGGACFPFDSFISVDVIAYMPIPKSATKAKRIGMEAKTVLPSRKPDVDNILKVALDALNGVAYKDDARVYSAGCTKFYGADPKLVITLREAGY